jgi:pimeloyl-ACP methyl ester carboxylesterase
MTPALETRSAIAASDAVKVGSGAPSVIFEAGLGSGAETWQPVLGRVGQLTTAFAYSRPGYDGGPLAPSDADGERNADEVARSLHQLLLNKKVSRPYVLVGHSLGGLYVLQYARLYPKEVAGIVLVDGRMPGFVGICAKAGAPCANPGPADAGSPAHIAAEVNGLAASEQMAPLPGELGNIPVTLLTRGIGESSFLSLWQASQDEFAGGLRNGRHIIARKSRHYIQNDEPDLVVAEIQRIITMTKGGPEAHAR